jgi:hypothetical protein
MAPYLQKALQQFDNIVPSKRQDLPYPYTELKYGAKQHFFAGIPVGQKFVYLSRNPPDSGRFLRILVPAKSCWLWPATKEGSLLSKIWTKMDLHLPLSSRERQRMKRRAPRLGRSRATQLPPSQAWRPPRPHTP